MKPLSVFVTIILAAGAAFYFWPQVSDFYQDFSGRVEEFEQDAIAAIEEISEDISVPEPLRAKIEAPSASLTQGGVIAATNAERVKAGLLPLTVNTKLASAAVTKASDMEIRQYFAHESPSGEGPADLARKAGYDFLAVGENLALGNFENDQVLVQAWMDSPGHRANILSEKYTEIGVAVLPGTYEGKKTWFAVQEFGRPVSDCPATDPILKNQIEVNEAELDERSAELLKKKAELEAMRPRRGPAYNQKVEEYNALVNAYNALISETKGLISQYNAQVRALNLCIGS